MNNLDLLIYGIKQLKLDLNDVSIAKLEQYISLLIKWNKIYSLTAIIEYDEIVKYHILDGLTVVRYLIDKKDIESVMDVGSGMGVPGVILAICFPSLRVILLDSNRKKTAFLQQVAIELKLDNVKVITSRIEDYITHDKFDVIVSRAFAESYTFIRLSKHLSKLDGKFLVMKSRLVDKELDDLSSYTYRKITVKIPNVNDERVLLEIDNK